MTRVLKEGDQQFLAVVVPGSAARPHFAGRSYVRRGSESQEASEAQFQALIAVRSSKVYQIRKWIGREVQVMLPDPTSTYKPLQCRLEEATSFWILVKPLGVPNADSGAFTVPLERVELAFSPKDDRLILVIDRWWPGFGK